MANNAGNKPIWPGPQPEQRTFAPYQKTTAEITPGDGTGTFVQIIGWGIIGLAGLGFLAGLGNLGSSYSSDEAPFQMGLAVAMGIQGFLLVGFGRLITLTGDLKFAAQRSEAYLNQGARDEQLVSILEELKASSQRSENYLAQLVRPESERQEHSNRVDTQDAEPALPTPATPGPADWYPDPYGAAQLRYWDGAAWTDHLHLPGDPS